MRVLTQLRGRAPTLVDVTGAATRALTMAGALLLVGVLPSAVAPADAQQRQQAVLVLHIVRRDGPAVELAERVLQATLTSGLGGHLDYYSEFIDAGRFDDPDFESALVDFLRRKYVRRKFDLVVTSSNRSLTFAEQYRDKLFPGVPIVFASSAHRPWPSAATGVVAPFDPTRTLESAIQLHPDLRQVVVVLGASTFDRAFEAAVRPQFRTLEHRFQFTYLVGLPMPELLRRVAVLPPETVIYYLYMSEDGAGARFLAVDALKQLVARANRPIYHHTDFGLGLGIVGGRMWDFETVMKATADVALRVLKGESPERIAVREVDGTSLAFDWRELRRWSIDEARLPAGSVVRFRQLSAWDQYKFYISGAIGLTLLQSSLIGALLVQSRRRKRLAATLRESEWRYRVAAEQNQDLSGRLISAQEEERTRIARELHDDVSQQVAGVSIILSTLKRELKQLSTQPEVEQLIATLQRRNSGVAHTVRTLSHELHPAVLDHAGLVDTLRRHCADVEALHTLTVTFSAQSNFDALPPDVSLCVYRVAQEAIANAVRHARATRICVQLLETGDNVELSVVDDGVGFIANDPGAKRGLGLRSIDERARLLRGTANLESRPGHGTTLRVSIPTA